MTSTSQGETPTIFPALRYKSGKEALDWFKAVGFDEWLVVHSSEGRLIHGEVKFGAGTVNIGEIGVAEGHEAVDEAGFGISVYVEDVDAHYLGAKASGLEIVQMPYDTDFGARMYGLKDPAGNLWVFGNYRPGL